MYKNFIVVACRNLLKNKLNTLIIVLGLGTGIACSILSFLFIHHELTFDRFHKNIDTIYEMKMVLVLPMGRAIADPKSHLALDLARKFSEVIHAVRVDKQDFVGRGRLHSLWRHDDEGQSGTVVSSVAESGVSGPCGKVRGTIPEKLHSREGLPGEVCAKGELSEKDSQDDVQSVSGIRA